MGLIVTGGIGFVVIHEVFYRLKGSEKKLSLHTKLVLITTGILIFGGATLFLFLRAQPRHPEYAVADPGPGVASSSP